MSETIVGAVVTLVRDKATGTKDPATRYIGLEHIDAGGGLNGSASAAVSTSVNGVFESGDLLFGKLRPNLRKSAQMHFGGYCSTDLLVLRAKAGVDPSFMRHAVTTEAVFRHAEANSIGTGMPRTSWKAVASAPAWLPDGVDQRQIAQILDTLDERIAQTDRILAKLSLVRQALFDRLFVTLAPVKSLNELLVGIDSGWSPLCQDRPPEGSEWGVLKVSAITSGRFRSNESKTVPSALGFRSEFIVHPGDVLMARANGVAALVGITTQVHDLGGKRLMLSDKTLRLRPAAAVCSAYLAIALQQSSARRQIDRLLNGSTGQSNISQRQIRTLGIPAPSHAAQVTVVEQVRAIDRRIDAERASVGKLRALGAGLRDDLLTGRVRTVPRDR